MKTWPMKTWLAALRRKFRDFARQDTGAAIVLFALATVPMVAFVGMGTDTARAYLVKSRMSSALDAAGLAGGRHFFSPTRDAEIVMFFNANFPPGYMNSTISGPHIVDDELAERLTLTAEAQIPTTLMKVLGFDTLTVTAETEITRQMQALDVVIAMDMSGSMSSSSGAGTRISAARQAAKDLVDILYGDNGSNDLLNIGLVPWNAKVNVMLEGSAYDSSLTSTVPVAGFVNPLTATGQSDVFQVNNSPVPLLSAPPANWRGCVFNRYLDNAADDDDADIFMGPQLLDGADWPAWEPVGIEGEPVSGGTCSMSTNGGECTRCLSHGITPLQNQKLTITNAIDALTNPGGNTNIPAGLAWAWRVLMPDAPFTEAVADPDYELQRAIVLLTDGENYGGNGDGYKAVFGLGSGAGANGMNDRLRLLATNIKSSGVVLYVIQFANNGTELQALLKDVASGPASPFYHYAPDDAALRAVFREIANDLSQLRLSK
ncbi:pilus assembly protein TadG-related protein [Thalassospiraceae bacterium LMO-JJ14]|nr:pilus assembly protein TadG-related protein [Thalassospiraceae bacterium LMO-JJ14]